MLIEILWGKLTMRLINIKYREFARFCIVGVIATAIHYGLYLFLIYMVQMDNAWWTSVAYSLGYLAGFFCNLWLSAHFTFKTEVTPIRSLGFVVTNAIMYGLHIALLNLYLYVGIPNQWAPIPVYMVAVPINFVLVRFVFKRLK